MKYRLPALILAILVIFGGMATANAVTAQTERDTAVEFLIEQGIYQNTASPNATIKRKDFAVIMVKVRGDLAEVKKNSRDYAWDCYFFDIDSDSAYKPYIGYCARNRLMLGYDITYFKPDDKLTPEEACAVLLRYLGIDEKGWKGGAVKKAVEIGIVDSAHVKGKSITKGNLAILICRAMQKANVANVVSSSDDSDIAASTIILSDTPITSKTHEAGTSWSREDYSKETGFIFDEVYTREAYNVLRQSYLDRDIIADDCDENGINHRYNYAFSDGSSDSKAIIRTAVTAIGSFYSFGITNEPYLKKALNYPTYFIITPRVHYLNESAEAVIDELLSQTEGMTDREKVTQFNAYLCSRIEYVTNKTSGLNSVFSSGAKANGNCSTFSYAMSYLCDRAGIPNIRVTGLNTKTNENHAWNLVHVDSAWLTVDVSGNAINADKTSYLLKASYPFPSANPRMMEFLKQVMVPTK